MSAARPATAAPLLRMEDGPGGAISADGLVAGCYVHGLFAHDAPTGRLAAPSRVPAAPRDQEADVEAVLDRLAAHVEAHVDVDCLLALAR